MTTLEKNLALEAELEKLKNEIQSRQSVLSEKKTSFEQKAHRQQEILKVSLS
jgi:hypothetical protein